MFLDNHTDDDFEDRQMGGEDNRHKKLALVLTILLFPVWLFFQFADLVARGWRAIVHPFWYVREPGILTLATYCPRCQAMPITVRSYTERFNYKRGYTRCTRCGAIATWGV